MSRTFVLNGEEVTNLDWIKNEFAPLTLATPDDTLNQMMENTIRYWNTNSAYKVSTLVDYTSSMKRIQIPVGIKSVCAVYPTKVQSYVWNDHPLWTLTGIAIIDCVTTDLILTSEAFKTFRQYVGSNFDWTYDKSDDPSIGGYLYVMNIPASSQGLVVIGTKRILPDEVIKSDHISDWLLRYYKCLVKQVEGNTLRKGGIIGIPNDGQAMFDEGIKEQDDLKKELAVNGRWTCFIARK